MGPFMTVDKFQKFWRLSTVFYIIIELTSED